VLSAPFIGSYPNASRISTFKAFSQPQTLCTYVPFSNLWGYRNVSRARALKKAMSDFIATDDAQKLILIYSAHTPFLEAAAYAKKADPRIRICFYVPDLPNYMNLRSDRSWIYDVAKKADIAKMNRLNRCVDSFVMLTGHMKEPLLVGDRPYRVVEGIVSQIPETVSCASKLEKYIVYTGKLDGAFGVKELVDAMEKLEDPSYRLVLCGQGDSYGYAVQASQKDSRIMALGQVSPEIAAQWQRKAAVLINPRGNVGEYTKYSFPSKNVEYLLSGKPVVAYQLHGMPQCYREFLYLIDDEKPAVEAIQDALEQAVSDDPSHKEEKYRSFIRYAEQNLRAKRIAERIMELTF
jgi:glycosyltransferase involved in cell wall biosynthesis